MSYKQVCANTRNWFEVAPRRGKLRGVPVLIVCTFFSRQCSERENMLDGKKGEHTQVRLSYYPWGCLLLAHTELRLCKIV